MRIHFEDKGDKLGVFLSGEIDHYVASKISSRIDERLENGRFKELAFDFSNVGFMDSSGIGMITGRVKRMQERNGAVSVSGCSPYVEKILKMAGIFTIVKYGGKEDE